VGLAGAADPGVVGVDSSGDRIPRGIWVDEADHLFLGAFPDTRAMLGAVAVSRPRWCGSGGAPWTRDFGALRSVRCRGRRGDGVVRAGAMALRVIDGGGGSGCHPTTGALRHLGAAVFFGHTPLQIAATFLLPAQWRRWSTRYARFHPKGTISGHAADRPNAGLAPVPV